MMTMKCSVISLILNQIKVLFNGLSQCHQFHDEVVINNNVDVAVNC